MSSAPQNFLTPRRFALLLGILVAVQFPAVLVGAKTFFFRDFGFFGYPLAAFHREAFWNGEIPLWNPYNNGGLPFLAQWNTMVLYPGSLIYLLLPLPWSLNLFCLAHQFLAGLGMYFLARHTTKSDLGAAVAGVAFAFSGLLLSSLKWPNNIAAFGWMPFVVLAAVRMWENPGLRPIAIAALVGSMQMLAGAPEVIILTWVVIGVLGAHECVVKRCGYPALKLAGLVVWVSAICAAQLIPFLELLRLSQRTGEFAAAEWPMPIWGWANFLVPLWRAFPSYHGVPAQLDQYWTSTYYVPLAAVAAALLGWRGGWRQRLLAALALFGALLALGNAGWIYKALREVFPPLSFMRFPIKFVVLPVFILPWLAAYGIASAKSLRGPVIALGAAALLISWMPPLTGTPQFSARAVSTNAVLRIGLAGAIAFALARRDKSLAALAAVALVWADARTHAPNQNPTSEKWVFDRDLVKMQDAPRLGFGRAMITPQADFKLGHLMFDKAEDDIGTSRLALYANANLIDRIPKVNGFFALYLKEANHLVDLIYANTNRAFPGLAKTFAASHFTAPDKTVDWMQAATNFPWVSGGQAVVIADAGETVRALADPEFDPGKRLLLPPGNATNAAADVKVEFAMSAHRINGGAEASAPTWLLVSQAFHPNWKARVGSDEVPIVKANYAFQAIRIPAGASSFELIYIDRGFQTGCVISGIGLLAALGMASRRTKNARSG